MKTSSQMKLYQLIDVMRERVLELEDVLKELIDDHKIFQIDRDLKKYESVLNKKINTEPAEFKERLLDQALESC